MTVPKVCAASPNNEASGADFCLHSVAATDVSAPVEATILVAAKARLESDQDVKDAVRALLTLHSDLGGQA